MESSSRSARGSTPSAADLITVGRIIAPHGVRGEVRVLLETDFPERFDHLHDAYLVRAGRVEAIQITGHRPHRNGILMMISGIDTLDGAEGLRGAEVAVPRAAAMPLGPDRYYIFEIIGLRVRTVDGHPLGVVAEVMQGPAHDIYVVRGGESEILVPALKEVVRRIDRTAGEMVVALPSGLEG
jgi:16S rRNA processing protein RimM